MQDGGKAAFSAELPPRRGYFSLRPIGYVQKESNVQEKEDSDKAYEGEETTLQDSTCERREEWPEKSCSYQEVGRALIRITRFGILGFVWASGTY